MFSTVCYSHCNGSLCNTEPVVTIGLHLFVLLKQHLEIRQFHNVEEVVMAVREWLRMQTPNSYVDKNL
jgi:hypothetical protein